MLAACSAQARELGLSIDGRVGGDSNVLRSGTDKVDDGFFEISPRISLTETGQEFNYDISYTPTYITFVDTPNIDGIDHLVRGDGRWSVTPLDSLAFNFRYSNRRRLRAEELQAGTDTLFPSDRNLLRRANGMVSYTRQLTSDWSAFISADIDDFDSAPDNRNSESDTRAYSLRIGGNHAFDSQTTAGLSAAGRYRDTRVQRIDGNFSDTPAPTDPSVPSSKTLIWDLSVSFTRELSETMDISLQVGPSFISTRLVPDIFFRGPPTNESTENTQDTSFFAAASFDKRWSRADFSINYVRSEFRGGFTTSATISDDVDVVVNYEWSRRIVTLLNAGWNQRIQIVEVSDRDNLDTTQWRFIFSQKYRINRKLSLIGQYVFRTQDVDGRVNSSGVGDTHTGFLSLRYTFDPIIF